MDINIKVQTFFYVEVDLKKTLVVIGTDNICGDMYRLHSGDRQNGNMKG